MKKVYTILTALVAFNAVAFASCDLFGENETTKEVNEVVVDVDGDDDAEVNS